jgi:hypothetical protein
LSEVWRAGDRIDRYELEKPLGAGGFGEVWRARLHGPMGFQRAVALKVIRLSEAGTPSAVEKLSTSLANEARLCGLLHHPNVVPVTDFGETGGSFYAVMELVHGVSLRAILERCAAAEVTLPPHLALQIALQVARGLQYAHNLADVDGHPLQVVHRDLKPENVMLGSDGVVKVLDFGIARSLSNLEQTRTGDAAIRGTPRYLSPEQLEAGRTVDARSDLFALGALLFEVLVGRPLFRSDQVFALLYEVVSRDLADDIAAAEQLSPGIGSLLGRLLQRDPDLRPAAAGEVADEITALLGPHADGQALARFARALEQGEATDSTATLLGPMTFPSPAASLVAVDDETRRWHGPQQAAARPRSRAQRLWRWAITLPFAVAALAALAWLAVPLVVPMAHSGARRGVVLGVQLQGEDDALARWALQRHLASSAAAFERDLPGRFPAGRSVLFDGRVDEDGDVTWVGARGESGWIGEGSEELVGMLGEPPGAVPALPWSGGFTVRMGVMPLEEEGFGTVTGLVSADGAPVMPLEEWRPRSRRALAQQVRRCVPGSLQHGDWLFRAELQLSGEASGWQLEQVRSLQPEAYTSRRGAREHEPLPSWEIPACLEQLDLGEPPRGLQGRTVVVQVLLGGQTDELSPTSPDNPAAAEDVVVVPPRVVIEPGDITVRYAAVPAEQAMEAVRRVEGVAGQLGACDGGLLAASGLIRAEILGRVALDGEGSRLSTEVVAAIGPMQDLACLDEESCAMAVEAVGACMDEVLDGMAWPVFDRLVVIDVTARLASPPPTLGEPGTYDRDEATRAVTARMLRREFDAVRCLDAHLPDEPGLQEVVYDWYAEVDAAGSVVRFLPRWSAVPPPAASGCLDRMSEELRLPASGFELEIDLRGQGAPAEMPADPVNAEQWRENVNASVGLRLSNVRRCWQAELARSPQAYAGNVEMRLDTEFTVASTGRLEGLVIEVAGRELPQLTDCVAATLMEVEFSPSRETNHVKSYPFKLSAE